MPKRNLIIREANLEDVKNLYQLEQLCFQTDCLTPKRWQHFIITHTAKVLLIETKEKLCASAIILLRKNSPIARLYSIAVDPTLQGLKIGQTFLVYLEKLCLKLDCREIRLEVRQDNLTAIQFYKKNQFKILKEIKNFYEDDMTAIQMSKSILAPVVNSPSFEECT
jgi:ribosomal protein S18 acetylase RimI-like enzyme